MSHLPTDILHEMMGFFFRKMKFFFILCTECAIHLQPSSYHNKPLNNACGDEEKGLSHCL